MKYSYDKEGDLLAIELANQPFDYAQEMGDLIVHFSKNDKPVYVEILNASTFLANAVKQLPKSKLQSVARAIHSAA